MDSVSTFPDGPPNQAERIEATYPAPRASEAIADAATRGWIAFRATPQDDSVLIEGFQWRGRGHEPSMGVNVYMTRLQALRLIGELADAVAETSTDLNP